MKTITQTTVDQWVSHLSVGGLPRWWTLGLLTRHRDQPAAARLLAQCLQKNAPLSMSQRAEKALRRITSQPALDAVIDCWLEDKAGETVRQVIEERGWRHSAEARWLNFLTKRNRFDEYFVAELAPLVHQPMTARMLAHPEGANASQAAAGAAAAVLGRISAPEMVDAVIDCWLEDKAGETVRQVIEERKWKHTIEAQWLKFLNKRNRFDEYFIAELTPLVNNPAVARMLAHPEGASASRTTAGAAADALGRISAQESVDTVIDCWLEDKAGETVRQVIEERGWRHSAEARWLNFLTKRNRFDEYFVAELAPLVNKPMIARMLAHPEGAKASNSAAEFDGYFVAELAPLVNKPTITRMLAYPEGAKASNTAAEAAAAALGQISAQESVDAVIDCWLEDKAGERVRQVIEERGWRHTAEVRWLKFLTKRNRFDEYFVAELAPLVNKPEMVARLLAHLDGEEDSHVARVAAAAALCQISSPEAVDAVIECWLEGKTDEALRQIIEERGWLQFTEVPWFEFFTKLEDRAGETVRKVIEGQGWRHSEEARWFLYLAATGRFEEYLAEDYEFQTLRPEFLAASAALKARIREAVVKAGEVRMNGLFLAEKRAAELTVADAEALVRTNIRNQNWQALAGNFWWLPARQILDAVQAISAAKWKPDDADQAALLTRLGELATLLATGAPEGSGTLRLNPVYQKWLSSGETGPLSQKPPAKLIAMLKNETDPPDQIAALGALRKQGELDAATVAKAGLSEHWMVRWVAVHFGADLTQAMRVNDAGIEWFRRLSTIKDAEVLWTAKPCEVTRDGLEALREHLARLPDPRAAGGLLLVEAICTHYTAHDIEVEEGARVMVEADSFELEG